MDEDDAPFFHLGIAFELAPEWQDVSAAMERANELNEELKAVKVTIHPEDRSARFHVEAFIDAPATMAVISRSVVALRNASRQLFEVVAREPRMLNA